MRRRRLRTLAAALGVATSAGLLVGSWSPPPALASTRQISIIQDSTRLLTNPGATLGTFRALGASMVRVIVVWAQVAPTPESRTAPAGFNAADPRRSALGGGPEDPRSGTRQPVLGLAPVAHRFRPVRARRG